MTRITRIITLAAVLVAAIVATEQATCGNLVSDPSAVPLLRGDSTYAERFRILGDINFDGTQDMVLSGDVSSSGQSGIQLTLFLQTDSGRFKEVGRMWAWPWRIAVEKLNDEIRIWGTSHHNAQTSGLYYYELVNDSLVNRKGMTIHPGDGGTNIGRAIAAAVINNSDAKLVVQRSRTLTDGKVVWEDR